MGNILDYIDWRGDITFAERPFNDVDNLILSELAYINMKDLIADDEYITLQQLYERWTKSDNKPNIPLNDPTERFKKAASSIRFRNIKAGRFSEIINTEKQLQFAAVTFMPGDGSAYISFRGTDDTLVGWREDCNLSFLAETPGQKEAVKYINAIAKQTSCLMRIGGHSKGGNLAVYAAVKVPMNIQDRIQTVWSNDGPGYQEDFITSESYLRMKPSPTRAAAVRRREPGSPSPSRSRRISARPPQRCAWTSRFRFPIFRSFPSSSCPFVFIV